MNDNPAMLDGPPAAFGYRNDPNGTLKSMKEKLKRFVERRRLRSHRRPVVVRRRPAIE